MKSIEIFFAVFSIISSTIYVWHKLLNIKINFRSVKLYVTLVCLMSIALINYFNVNEYLRITVVTILLMIFFYYLFRENLQKCIITPIYSQILVMISEVIFAIIISSIFELNSLDIEKTQFATFGANFIISCILVLLSCLPTIKIIYHLLIKITDKIRNVHLIIFIFLITLIANVLAMLAYYEVEFSYLLIFNTMLTLFCILIVLYSFKTRNSYIKVYDKYNTTLNSLKEYEDILDRYRVSNHENKNQLLTIRNMIPKTNKKVINYIDTIVENKLKDNDKIMLETAKIPTGGLRGLIYSKLLLMKDLGINYELEISNNVRTVDLINNIDDSDMLDTCKIIGVYLDNSIQAVEKLKEKYVNIEMYLEKENLFISISNNYESIIDLEKLDEKGYTSKGDGHGYGLSLTKEIIDNNKRLSNERKMSKDIFTQVLKIRM